MATDLLEDFQPLAPEETESAILVRWRDWANEGLAPGEDPDRWTDTREGTPWYVNSRQAIREFARLYDLAGTDVPASAFPKWSWGEYLDDHGELFALLRLPSTAASGIETFTGPNGTQIPAGTTVGVEPSTPDEDVLEYEVTQAGVIPAGGSIDLPIRARGTGSEYNVGIDAVDTLLTPLDGNPTVTNAAPVVGGTDPETDEALKRRIFDRYGGAAAANLVYYRRIALNYPGIGRVTVRPTARGAGTVDIIISTAEGDPVSAETLAGFQAFIDPVPDGAGEGQTGADIDVLTTTLLLTDVVAVLELDDGYSLDGGAGTIAVRARIREALEAYLATVEPGEEIVKRALTAAFMSVEGVHDVNITTPAATSTVPAAPPQIPVLDDLTLTVGAVA